MALYPYVNKVSRRDLIARKAGGADGASCRRGQANRDRGARAPWRRAASGRTHMVERPGPERRRYTIGVDRQRIRVAGDTTLPVSHRLTPSHTVRRPPLPNIWRRRWRSPAACC